MRTALVLATAIAAACGNSGTSGDDGGDHDDAMPGDDAGSGSNNDGGVDAPVDATVLIDAPLGTLGMCAVATQTGCAAGQGCYPRADALMNFDARGACAVTAGLPAGGSCLFSSDCAAGLVCEGGGGGNGRCRAICTSSATCPTASPTCTLYQHGEYARCL